MNYKKLKKITLLLVLFITQIILANNLNISNVTKISDNKLSFDVSWDNSWWVSTYRDAAWIFIKYKNSSGQWQHLDITSATVSGFTLYTYPDNKGVMLSRQFSGQGTVTGSVTVQFNDGILGPLPDFKVFGIEMVYINQGAFWVGDGDGALTTFHQGNNVNLPYHIQSAGEITVGNTSNDLKANDLTQNIPATYPNGYDSFYMMKYEITQEQYVEFLNTLTVQQQQTRTESDLANITASNRFVMSNSSLPNSRNGIACDSNATNTTPIHFYCDLNNNEFENENNDGQNLACNYLAVSDAIAYTDWAALRPATEFEYEKACRGTAYPIIDEYANGTIIIVNYGTIINSGMPNETYSNVGTNGLINSSVSPIRVGGFATSTTTRLQSGAGFYGNVELSGNTAEYCVLSQQGNYSGTLGDGVLNVYGNQNTWDSLATYFMPRGSNIVSKRNNFYTPITDLSRYQLGHNIRGCR